MGAAQSFHATMNIQPASCRQSTRDLDDQSCGEELASLQLADEDSDLARCVFPTRAACHWTSDLTQKGYVLCLPCRGIAAADNRKKRTPAVVYDSSTITRLRSRDKVSSVGATSSTCEPSSAPNEDGNDSRRPSYCSSDDNESIDAEFDGDLDLDGDLVLDFGRKESQSYRHRRHRVTPPVTKKATPSRLSKEPLEASTSSSSTELGEIQQSVQRLRAQRTHVERLRQHNEHLERQVAHQKAENETLQCEIRMLRGAEQENVSYLQSVKLLEQRARGLEETCSAKKIELKAVVEKLNAVEQERDQLLQAVVNAREDHEEDVRAFEDRQMKKQQRMEQLEQACTTHAEAQKRLERHWKQKLKVASRLHSQTIDSLQHQLAQSLQESSKLENDAHELEEQVQKLLATTVRQTTVIEECDRVVSGSKAQQQQAQCSYEDQLKLNGELSAKMQRLETQVASLKLSSGSELGRWEKKVTLLEKKLTKRKGQLERIQAVARDKQSEIDTAQREHLTRDRSHSRLNEDAADEKGLLSDQVLELQEQLESERKDRSRWATARLKLLAEFCDEESKLSSVLHHNHAASSDDELLAVEREDEVAASFHRKAEKTRKAVDRNTVKEWSSDVDSNESDEDERRISSIVFG
ncbi:hypothetical protein BBJ28_00025117 [Nothophytophthora sp. Chile5]|nr:hypothetical protein BBJ28_00025117 [Nothophytophthora sp. Chile5]